MCDSETLGDIRGCHQVKIRSVRSNQYLEGFFSWNGHFPPGEILPAVPYAGKCQPGCQSSESHVRERGLRILLGKVSISTYTCCFCRPLCLSAPPEPWTPSTQCPSLVCWGGFLSCLWCEKGYKRFSASLTEFQPIFVFQPHLSPLPPERTGTTIPETLQAPKAGFCF